MRRVRKSPGTGAAYGLAGLSAVFPSSAPNVSPISPWLAANRLASARLVVPVLA